MTKTLFSVSARAWLEMCQAVRPHLSKDDSRPLLLMAHVVTTDDGRVYVEACDSYTLIRAIGSSDEAAGPYALSDLMVPGAEFLGFKPKADRVTCTFDGTTVTLTGGTNSIMLEAVSHLGTLPDLDRMFTSRAQVTATEALSLNASMMGSKLAKLPKGQPTVFRFSGPLGPTQFYCTGGTSKGFESPFFYQGAFVPLRTNGDAESRTWETLPHTPKEAPC